jgi:beta-glucosidase
MKLKILFYHVLLVFCLSFFVGCKVNNGVVSQEDEESRIDSLMNLMTTQEKIGQLTLFTSDWAVTGPTMRDTYKDDIKSGRVGAIFNAHTADYTCELQRMAVEETRLGIPLLFGYDVVHGYKTIFPISLGEAASFDLDAIEKSARIAAAEASSAGLHWTFAPMVDISRDPRWGRVSEGAGEDVYYSNLVSAARVKGFQGDDLGATNTLAACAKHFAAYGAAQAGRDYHTVDISERTLREVYLPPFEAAIEAGVRTFMTSFNELNGVPASGNKMLLTDILREEWQFDGFVVTDYTSINEMVDHGNVANLKEAGELALTSGVDMDMQGAVFYDHMEKSLEEGKVTMAQIDQAVRRILKIKEELGLFDDPFKYCQPSRQESTLLSEEHLEFAREIARKSIVLLKNDKQVLPIDPGSKIALIGPLADTQYDLLGSWHGAGNANDCITPLRGMQAQSTGGVHYVKGCEINGEDRSGFEEAIQLAKSADIVVLAIGESANMSGEAACRTDIGLPTVQLDLAKAIVETGKPVVVVLMNGRPMAIPWLDENTDAILETWYLGTQAGNAIADVIYGKYNPSGKLPVTFPRNVGQIPIFYYMKNTGRPMEENDKYTSKYLDSENSPLYPFGYGLSYSDFKYSDLSVVPQKVKKGQDIRITVNVNNYGDYDGEEVVQVYVRDLVGSVTRPVRELKAFKKVFVEKGKYKAVSFTLTTEDLKFYDINMNYTVEPGEFEIFVGGSSEAKFSRKIKLVE